MKLLKRLRGPTRFLALVLLATLALSLVFPEGNKTTFAAKTVATTKSPASERYRLDPSQSTFIAHALRGGLLWFKGHEHLVAARDFSGYAEITRTAINPASLVLAVKSASMEETNTVFTNQQKQIINKELRDIVLLPERYPEITFKSNEVNGRAISNTEYDLKIGGDLTLLGATRHLEIPTHVTLVGNDLRAHGEFSIDRSDYKVKATSAFHGMVRVQNKVRFTFDIVGHRQ